MKSNSGPTQSIPRWFDGKIRLPGLATAHSHAFQRGLRGLTHRKNRASGAESFWSWRGLMYELAGKLTPDDIRDLSRWAFVELALNGVTAVGEFHYVHHQADGTPYDDRSELSQAVISAAKDAGIKISLLRVLYGRGGANQKMEAAQRRFCDPDVGLGLADVDVLRARHRGDESVAIGVAPHSVRALPIEAIEEARDFADARQMPFHMHVSEQEAEVTQCLAEYGHRPVALLADRGILGPRFVAVHATHLQEHEIQALGQSGSFVCICRSTERDLGDGLPPTNALLNAGARLCFGVDSHAQSDAFEEARATELDERSRRQMRVAAAEAGPLLKAATAEGYAAIGMLESAAEDHILVDPNHASLLGITETPEYVDDALIFNASAGCVDEVWVSGKRIVEGGRHIRQEEAKRAYLACLKRLIG